MNKEYGRRQLVNQRLSESWLLKEPQGGVVLRAEQPAFSAAPTAALKGVSSWFRANVRPVKVHTSNAKKSSSGISLDDKEVLKKALVDRKVKTVLARSLALILEDPSKNAKLCTEDQLPIDVTSDLIAQNFVDKAFHMVDLGKLAKNAINFKAVFPMFNPVLAVAQNSDEVIVQLMALSGVALNCQTSQDVEGLGSLQLSANNDLKLRDCNPCKSRSHINSLVRNDARFFCVDSSDEIKKIAIAFSKAEKTSALSSIKLAINVGTIDCTCATKPENSCFCGPCAVSEIHTMVSHSKLLGISRFELQLNLDGLWDTALESGHIAPLDIFPLDNLPKLQATMAQLKIVNDSLEHSLTAPASLHFLGLPPRGSAGRAAAASLHQLVNQTFPVLGRKGLVSVEASAVLLHGGTHLGARVQGRRAASNPLDPTYAGVQYYLDDGCYGSLSSLLLDDCEKMNSFSAPQPLDNTGRPVPKTIMTASTVWGPTCDGVDCIMRVAALPRLNAGDWVLFEDVGSGAPASFSTAFNGLKPAQPIYCFFR